MLLISYRLSRDTVHYGMSSPRRWGSKPLAVVLNSRLLMIVLLFELARHFQEWVSVDTTEASRRKEEILRPKDVESEVERESPGTDPPSRIRTLSS